MKRCRVVVNVDVVIETLDGQKDSDGTGWSRIATCETVVGGEAIADMPSDHAAKYVAQFTQDSVEDMLEED
jgi:hypothetical protein